MAQLQTLAVDDHDTDDYDRDEFGHRWKDIERNGCGQRDDVLRRDLASFVTKTGTGGCVVISGDLEDPYSGIAVSFEKGEADLVPIDHVVSLANAWQTGARAWEADDRERFANEPLNLLAVTRHQNESKGDKDASEWLPFNAQCRFVARQVAVKAEFGLWVTKAERAEMVEVLSECPDAVPPAETEFATPNRDPSTDEPAPRPKRTEEPEPEQSEEPKAEETDEPRESESDDDEEDSGSTYPVVHPGSFCSGEGSLGVTTKGTLMRCSFKSGDDRLRWRKAG